MTQEARKEDEKGSGG